MRPPATRLSWEHPAGEDGTSDFQVAAGVPHCRPQAPDVATAGSKAYIPIVNYQE